MIERYTRPEMARIWTAENRFRKWLDIEIYACEAHAEMGTIPREAVERITTPRFRRLWHYYLCYCEAGFAEGYNGDVQMLFARPRAGG